MTEKSTKLTGISRRSALKTLGAGAAGLAGSGLFMPAVFAAKTVKIGYVSPQTGPLAAFGEPDAFTLDQLNKVLAGGVQSGGQNLAVEIIYKDSQSDSNRAAEAASELILKDNCDIIVAASTPATTNPVADQCEINGVPCVTNDTPWQPHFFGRGGDPAKGFDWTYHFFWGLEDLIGTSTALWGKIDTNKSLGALWPNDSDGNAFGDPKLGFPPVVDSLGYKLTDPGRYQSPADDFSAYINEFKKNDVQVITGVMPPPDFANFWSQAGQQGLNPKIMMMPKATEFPAAVAALGDRGHGISVEVWWSPVHPFSSGLTGQSSAEFAKAYEDFSGRQWSMPMAFKHALFEVAIDAIKRSDGAGSPEAIRDAIKTTDYKSIVGPVNFQTGPVPNISKTPLVSGQWHKDGDKFDLRIVENSLAPDVPVQDELFALS